MAVLGAVFANRLISQLKLHATAAELKLISGSNLTANPAQIDHLPPSQRTFVISAFSHSVETAFLVAVPFVVAGLHPQLADQGDPAADDGVRGHR